MLNLSDLNMPLLIKKDLHYSNQKSNKRKGV